MRKQVCWRRVAPGDADQPETEVTAVNSIAVFFISALLGAIVDFVYPCQSKRR